jgi:hypothetical protein
MKFYIDAMCSSVVFCFLLKQNEMPTKLQKVKEKEGATIS